MVSEVSKALKVYEALEPAGKRLFREELGLVRPQQAIKRKARRSKTLTADEPVIRQTRRRRVDTIDGVVAPSQPTT